jgi:hypothetical protein
VVGKWFSRATGAAALYLSGVHKQSTFLIDSLLAAVRAENGPRKVAFGAPRFIFYLK